MVNTVFEMPLYFDNVNSACNTIRGCNIENSSCHSYLASTVSNAVLMDADATTSRREVTTGNTITSEQQIWRSKRPQRLRRRPVHISREWRRAARRS